MGREPASSHPDKANWMERQRTNYGQSHGHLAQPTLTKCIQKTCRTSHLLGNTAARQNDLLNMVPRHGP